MALESFPEKKKKYWLIQNSSGEFVPSRVSFRLQRAVHPAY
jgi:hypothetical protein